VTAARVIERAHELARSPRNSNEANAVLDLPDAERFVMLLAYGVCGGILHALGTSAGEAAAPMPTQVKPAAEVMSADEVADLLRLDRKTVYDYAGRGVIPCRRIGKRLLFSREALALWLASCSKRSSEGNSK
jgi:excisionase family DNA binding protein